MQIGTFGTTSPISTSWWRPESQGQTDSSTQILDRYESSQQEWTPYRPMRFAAQTSSRPQTPPTQTSPTPQQEREYEAPDPTKQFVSAKETERTPEIIAAQEAAVEKALTGKKDVTFANSEARSFPMSLRKAGKSEVGDVYLYGAGKDKLRITISSNYKPEQQKQALAKIIDYYSQEPAHLRSRVKNVELLPGYDTVKVRKDQTLLEILKSRGVKNIDQGYLDAIAKGNGLKSADEIKAGQSLRLERLDGGGAEMDAPSGTMRFKGKGVLDESYFKHEFGHAVAYGITAEYLPKRWHAIAAKDKGELSLYGASREKSGAPNRVEDFAEAYVAYTEARETGPIALAALKKRFPNRMAEIERIYENRR